MTSSDYRCDVTRAQMKDAFEAIVPPDWGETEPIEAIMELPDWADRKPEDRTCVYVSIAGDVYSEAVAVVVAGEDDHLRIRRVEWGRP